MANCDVLLAAAPDTPDRYTTVAMCARELMLLCKYVRCVFVKNRRVRHQTHI